jgi:outer membrane lipoprotein-sorting protein
MSRQPVEARDPILGSALRQLDVPAHDASFWVELRRQLEVDQLPRRRRWNQFPRARQMRLVASAVAAAAAALALVLVLGKGAPTATAAQVRARVLATLGAVRSVSGVVVARQPDGTGRVLNASWQFDLSADGSLRIQGIRPYHTRLVYNAARNLEWFSPGPGQESGLSLRTGIAPGVPDSFRATWVVQLTLDTVLRTLAQAGDARVRTVDFDGRPAWFLRYRTRSGDVHEVTVDRASGFPVREVVRLTNGGFLETAVHRLRVNPLLPPGTFWLRFPAGSRVDRMDDGFQRVTLSRAHAIVGYRPLVPSFVPAGFRRDRVAVARRARGTALPSRNVVSISYRRGLQQLVVTTRAVGLRPSAWGDPFQADPGRSPRRVKLRSGALAGHRASVVVDPASTPHLWVLSRTLVVTVAGDLDTEQLVRIAESLHPLGARYERRTK